MHKWGQYLCDGTYIYKLCTNWASTFVMVHINYTQTSTLLSFHNDLFKQSNRFLDINSDLADNSKKILIDNLLLNKIQQWYIINPIAKEIIIRKIDDKKRINMHKKASDFYARFFEAKETKKNGIL